MLRGIILDRDSSQLTHLHRSVDLSCHQSGHSLDRPQIANLFELSVGPTHNKLVTDNPDLDGLSLSRSMSDMPMSSCSPSKNREEDAMGVSQTTSSPGQKSLVTPMKTLIVEEMSKDVEIRCANSNVVAKLMGLVALPQEKPHMCDKKSQSRTYPNICNTTMERAAGFWDEECLFLDKGAQDELLQFHKGKDNMDFHEMFQQSDNPNNVRELLPQVGRRAKIKHEKMALVRQKFIEAKRLVTDEELCHTKEFRDALEVLSENRELFLSFLQESNSLLSGSLREPQSLPYETKRITLLRPSKMAGHEKFSMTRNQNDELMNKRPLVAEPTRLDAGDADHVHDCTNEDGQGCPPPPTQIVVLKHSSGKNGKTTSSLPCYEDASHDEKLESSDVTGEVPCETRENLATRRRNGTMLSSVYSYGYRGDDSSFYKSEGDAIGDLCDPKVMSPPCRHSWDFINKVGTPCSFSSFGCASYSESSVCGEAKRRISERWALMASHQTSHEPRHVRKESSTLGEMLALLDTNKKSAKKEQQQIDPPSWSNSDSNKEECLDYSPKCLVRSMSTPVFSLAYSDNHNVEEVDPQIGKSNAQKAVAKKGDVKQSSFKGKVSSLFSFMSRKQKKETSGKPRHEDKIQPATVDSLGNWTEGKTCDDTSEVCNDNCIGECSSPSQTKSLPQDADSHRIRDPVVDEVGLTGSKSQVPDSKDNKDHPSPISVLDPSFDEYDSLASESLAGEQGPVLPLRSNLIDKSPPIGSIARTLSMDDAIDEAAAPYFSKSPDVFPIVEEELDWHALVQTHLSEAGFDGLTSISRWFSQESPLDPSLREKLAYGGKGMMMPEANLGQKRSERKLAYDCVNTALVKVTGGCGPNWCLSNGPYAEARDGAGLATLSTIRDHVRAQVKEWLSDEVRCGSKDEMDSSSSSSSLGVEKVVRNEVVGKGWVHHLAIEMDCLGKDIEFKLVDELVDEAVTDLTERLQFY
ncbi:hypothetical protein MLD38_021692 [Melastoma candidum]|uniref:Uncharacterized protein n=1 Tax=Melastoma candidum TaxID=119954 RepID=A0ACB9QG91_9MYRT|nr:hypothetical protein MLD38_021692 [Melastoma candidum]